MDRSYFRKGALLTLVIILAFSALGVELHRRASAQGGPEGAPPEVTANPDGWPLPNKDYENTRAASNATIDSTNVNQLGLSWSFPIPGGSDYGAAATNPVVADGVIYFQDLASNVYAVNLADGSLLWQTNYDIGNIGPNGVAVGWDKVYASKGSDSIVALNKADGTEAWTTVVRTQNDSEGITIQPTVYNGLVYISTVPGTVSEDFYAGGVGGIIYALNAETGEIVWSFKTVDSDDLWGNPEVNSGGGSWYVPGIDTATGITYWSVANPAPWPGNADFPNGSSRPGPNLYSNSLVALDNAAGQLMWYTQVRSHDLFDLDLQISPILTSATVQGTDHDIVITAGKLGIVFAMDRATGEVLWQTPVGKHQNDTVQEVPDNGGNPIEVYPGPLGGVETPMAYADGVVYVPVVDLPGYYTPTMFDDSKFDFTLARGELVALDVNTGAILWKKDYPTMNIGAATVVNDLVFTATMDGAMYAYNRTTGEEVWRAQAPAGVNGWPAVVGDTIIWPAGMGQNPVLMALTIGGEALPLPAGDNQAQGDTQYQGEGQSNQEGEGAQPSNEMQAGQQATQEAQPSATEEAGNDTSANTAGLDGNQLVDERCTACHSRERIDSADKDEAGWTATVDRMIGYGAQLNDAERQAVIDYLVETH